jgi:hypothetical protein
VTPAGLDLLSTANRLGTTRMHVGAYRFANASDISLGWKWVDDTDPSNINVSTWTVLLGFMGGFSS